MAIATSVIIVSWNSRDELARLLEGKRFDGTSTYAMLDSPPSELWVVDNGSEDGSSDYVGGLRGRGVHLIANEVNVGYPKAVNQALKLAGGDILVVMNPDIEITRPDWLEMTVSCAQEKTLLGQRLVISKFPYPDRTPNVYLEGYFLSFPRKFLEEVGFLWEGAGLGYHDDVELSWRAMKKGWVLREQRGIPIFHHTGTSYTYRQGKELWVAEKLVTRDKLLEKMRRSDLTWTGTWRGADPKGG